MEALETLLDVVTDESDRDSLELDGDLNELLRLWGRIKDYQARLKILETAVGAEIGDELGPDGAVRYGPNLIRYKARTKETCVDPDGFTAYVTGLIVEGELRFDQLVNPSYVKKSAIKGAIRDTFFERYTEGEPTIQVMPIDKAPKWAQDLKEGERR